MSRHNASGDSTTSATTTSASATTTSTTSASTTGDAPAPAPVHDDEGQTLGAWTACGGIIAASLVAAAAVILGSIPLTVAAVAVALAGLAFGALIERSRRAKAVGQSDDEQTDAHPGGSTAGSGARARDGRPYDREADDD